MYIFVIIIFSFETYLVQYDLGTTILTVIQQAKIMVSPKRIYVNIFIC